MVNTKTRLRFIFSWDVTRVLDEECPGIFFRSSIRDVDPVERVSMSPSVLARDAGRLEHSLWSIITFTSYRSTLLLLLTWTYQSGRRKFCIP